MRGGHNGLVRACQLARGAVDVLVLEPVRQSGGGSRTQETVPGYRFDTHWVARNIINMTSIPRELELRTAGLSGGAAARARAEAAASSTGGLRGRLCASSSNLAPSLVLNG